MKTRRQYMDRYAMTKCQIMYNCKGRNENDDKKKTKVSDLENVFKK